MDAVGDYSLIVEHVGVLVGSYALQFDSHYKLPNVLGISRKCRCGSDIAAGLCNYADAVMQPIHHDGAIAADAWPATIR